ncbi:MAG: glycine oxidase ThiO [Thiomonas arsenitoxydans]|uniref:Glycine oxidase ThiO n=1 Tax=Thiomonas arsenitoxydans (strain DSM 22701 / CIP 110005 / 3As) TaxID=426114 RepID=A0A8I1MYC5_THIA3|nr:MULTISPECIES: glycine oxidase ThiO [Thiomonas]MBN8744227.1 glycine oxidase ThiO [Thiomonas arsenitoxydans]ODU97382.1 MAG: glycine oxidase ThiO [Thiomonas sp. SCN 64-16]
MTRTAEVVIAGAGLAGRLLAWRLLSAGVPVTLVDARDRDDLDHAAGVAAAMLAPYAELVVGDADLFALGEQSLAIWPQWLATLQAQTGQAVDFHHEGSLVVAHAPDYPGLAHYADLIRYRLPADKRDAVQSLDGPGIAALEPEFAGRFSRGLWLPLEGQLDNGQLLQALQAAIEQAMARVGGQWLERTTVQSVQARSVHTTDGALIEADAVVDCRGVNAAWPGVRGVRGEVLTVTCPAVNLRRPVRLIHPRYMLYIVPRSEGRFIIGATELESQDTGPITVRSMLELASALYSVHPAFGEARITRVATSLRPATDDHQPVWKQREGVWQLNGFYRHGYLVAPAMVQRAERDLLALLRSQTVETLG